MESRSKSSWFDIVPKNQAVNGDVPGPSSYPPSTTPQSLSPALLESQAQSKCPRNRRRIKRLEKKTHSTSEGT